MDPRQETFESERYPVVTAEDVEISYLTPEIATYKINYLGNGAERPIYIQELIREGKRTIFKEFSIGDNIHVEKVQLGTLYFNTESKQVVFTPEEGTPRVQVVGDSKINAELHELINETEF